MILQCTFSAFLSHTKCYIDLFAWSLHCGPRQKTALFSINHAEECHRRPSNIATIPKWRKVAACKFDTSTSMLDTVSVHPCHVFFL